jgi:hypothetical protein
MPVVVQKLGSAALELHVYGVLDRADYAQFVPLAERCIDDAGALNLVVELSGFRGWSAAAFWNDLVFTLKHTSDVDRCALVGDDAGRQWFTPLATRLGGGTQIKTFAEEDLGAARDWAAAD